MNDTPRRCDLHLHTRYSAWKHLRVLRARDSYTEPAVAFARAKAAGMDYVAFTDHESIEGAMRFLDARPERAAEVIVGEEVETFFPETGQWIHVGVYGVDAERHRGLQRRRRDVRDLVDYLRAERLLFVLNHPFQSFRFQKTARDYASDLQSLFTHIEAGNGTMSRSHLKAACALVDRAAAAGRPLVCVAGSDAHVPGTIGSSHTVAAGGTAAEFLANVARGDCAWTCRPIGPARLLLHVYRAVGRYYLELPRETAEAGLRPSTLAAAAALVPGSILGVPAALTLLNRARQEAVSRLVRRALLRASGEPAAAERPSPAHAPDVAEAVD